MSKSETPSGSDPIGVAYWTRERDKVLSWIDLLAAHHIKFTMRAYNEGAWSEQIVYMFRLEPAPGKGVQRFLKEHGFEHEFFIYKKEKNDRA